MSCTLHDDLSTLFVQDSDIIVIEGGFTYMIAQCPNGQQGLIDPLEKDAILVLVESSWSTRAHIFPGLNKALLSIGTLCDCGCEVIFNDNSFLVMNKRR